MRKFRYVLSFVVIFVIALLVGLSLRRDPESSFAEVEVPGERAASQVEDSADDGRAWIETGWAAYGDLVTVSEAEQRLPYQMPDVTYLPDKAQVEDIYVSPMSVDSQDHRLVLVYSNGIEIEVNQNHGQINLGWDSILEEADSPFMLVKVNGATALGADPGNREINKGQFVHHTGSVMWQNGDLVITVYGEYPLEELVKIAESMQFAQN